MPEEEKKHDEHRKLPFNIKLRKIDVISIVILVIFIILVSIPVYAPKGECEIARPAYKCASIKSVMIENCEYWGNYNCDTNADISLKQIEWYIQNLCSLQNQHHNSGLDCSNLKSACNQISEKQICSIL